LNKDQNVRANSPWMSFIGPASILVGFLLFSLLLHFPHDWQHWSADLITSRLSPRLDHQHPDIALIYISNDSLKDYDYLSPVDREFLAKLIKRVDSAGARVIGLDIILDRHTERSKDLLLQDTLAKTRAKIVLGVVDAHDSAAHAQAEYVEISNRRTGFSTGSLYLGEIHSSLVVSDHVVRLWDAWAEEPPLRRSKNMGERPTFAESLARAAGLEFTPDSPYIAWLLKPRNGTGLVATMHAWFSPPKNGSDTFLTLSADDVTNPKPAGLRIPDLLNDKIVLIGGNFDDRDQHLTPLSASRDEFYPGAFIQAQILAQFLAGRSMHEFSSPVTISLALAVGVGAFLWSRNSRFQHIWVELVIVAGLVAITVMAFVLADRIIPCNLWVIVGLTGAALGHYAYGKKGPQHVN
jgi:adenylate cyclase